MLYADSELHKMYEEAMRRGDKLLATSIMAVAMARSEDTQGELQNLLTMFTGYMVARSEVQKGGSDHGNRDALTALDPSAVISI